VQIVLLVFILWVPFSYCLLLFIAQQKFSYQISKGTGSQSSGVSFEIWLRHRSLTTSGTVILVLRMLPKQKAVTR
jgi:hypothetical protein